ncbi:MAG: hypothetical protein ACLGJC_25395 [Alphaproteobacteria bacterium]
MPEVQAKKPGDPMAISTFPPAGEHREVWWFERYSPPEPGMVLLDVRLVCGGRRCMFVWGWRLPSPGAPMEIVCWSEPAETLLDIDVALDRATVGRSVIEEER